MSDCIFCKIIAGEIPSYKVYEDDLVYAFLDISQNTPGHTLLVPKEHVANLFDYDEQLAQDDSNPAIEGMNVVNNNGAVAYQSVFHSHIHLIPRYTKDDDFSIHFVDNSGEYNEEKYTAIQQAIIDHLED